MLLLTARGRYRQKDQAMRGGEPEFSNNTGYGDDLVGHEVDREGMMGMDRAGTPEQDREEQASEQPVHVTVHSVVIITLSLTNLDSGLSSKTPVTWLSYGVPSNRILNRIHRTCRVDSEMIYDTVMQRGINYVTLRLPDDNYISFI